MQFGSNKWRKKEMLQTEQARREKGQHMNASSVKKDAVQHVLRNISKEKML